MQEERLNTLNVNLFDKDVTENPPFSGFFVASISPRKQRNGNTILIYEL